MLGFLQNNVPDLQLLYHVQRLNVTVNIHSSTAIKYYKKNLSYIIFSPIRRETSLRLLLRHFYYLNILKWPIVYKVNVVFH